MLFVFFAAFAGYWKLPVNPYLFAGILAGTLGALIYSSMRLAVLMSIITSPVCIIFFTFAKHPINLHQLLIVVMLIGAVVGALYGIFSTGSRVNRADAKTLAGFSSGWLVSLGYLLISSLVETHSISLVVALMCPITGIIYVILVPNFIKLYDDLLPPIGDGLIVGIGVSGFVTLSFFIMISSIDNSVGGPLTSLLNTVRDDLPSAIFGGMLSAGLAGIVSGLLLTDWQDL
ncbi:MAG: hypothetical protein P8179_12685 [Candidatus Thiodiazotropha sp.]